MSDAHTKDFLLTEDDRGILQRSCDDAGVPSDIVERMIEGETKLYGMGRRHGIWEMLEALVAEGIQREQREEVQP